MPPRHAKIKGQDREEIGKVLGISRATVYRHVKEIEQLHRSEIEKQSLAQN